MSYQQETHQPAALPGGELDGPRERAGATQAFSYELAYQRDAELLLHQRGNFRIRLADTRGRRANVSLLIERMYTWRGYASNPVGICSSNPHQITLVAYRGERLFGTLTAGLDSEAGLQVDQHYRAEIDALRARQRRICEFTRLAVDPEYGSKDALAALFHLGFIYAHRIHQSDDIFIEVNPRHVAYYKRMLGFTEAGPEKLCGRVGAPAVLLHISCSYADRQIALHGGHQTSGGRSLYPHFFSKREEDGLCARLQRLEEPA
jgi:hypothetical protein